jgi:hypothetical protein
MRDALRQILDQIRTGPALFAGLPGDEVDLDRLTAHLAARRVDGGIYVTDGALEGILWVQDGGAGDTWFFEEGGPDAVLPAASGRELLGEIARRGGLTSVFLWRLPVAVTTGGGSAAAVLPASLRAGVPPPEAPPASPATEPVPVAEITDVPATPEALAEALAEAVAAVAAEQLEPSVRPWPAILAEVLRRLVRQRGPKMGGMFSHALAQALAARGGRVDDEQVAAPPLPEPVWRQVVEEASAPVVAVAGRAFVDRLVAAAERAIAESEGGTT